VDYCIRSDVEVHRVIVLTVRQGRSILCVHFTSYVPT